MATQIDLQPYQLRRPEKVEWWWAGGSDLFGGIRSKSLRSFLQKTDQVLATAGITWTHTPVSERDYLSWLPYYREKMIELGYDLFATEEWYSTKVAEGKNIQAIFCYQNTKMIGSAILSRAGDTAILHFKASDRINLASDSNSSLGAVIDFLFLKLMIAENVSKISSGTSRNAFGVINSYGYLDYKLRLGFDPSAPAESVWESSVPVNEDGEVVFYGLKGEEKAFFRLHPANTTKAFDDARLKSLSIPFIEMSY